MKTKPRTPAHLPLNTLAAAIAAGLLSASSTALAVNVTSQNEYNTALQAGNDITITNNGFNITAMPFFPIGGNVTITGSVSGSAVAGDPLSTLNGNGGDWYAFTNFSSSSVLATISDVAIENFGRVGVNNQEVLLSLPLTVNNVRFANNTNSGNQYYGGGFVTRYLGSVNNSAFINNRATNASTLSGAGGAFAVYVDMTGNITNSIFTNNFAANMGGAVFLGIYSSTATIQSSTFTGNAAQAEGGAVAAGSFYAVDDSSFFDNSADYGGAIFVDDSPSGGPFNVIGSTFIGNRTHGSVSGFSDGGALFQNAGDLQISGSVFLNNRAQGDNTITGIGGAISHNNPSGTIQTVEVEGSSSAMTLFYGNQHYPDINGSAPNGITLWGASGGTTNLTISGNGDVLMLDPFWVQDTLTSNFNKTTASTWYQGGVSDIGGLSTWDIQAGTLALTTVNYGDGNLVDAVINMKVPGGSNPGSSFTLASGATLTGSGTIAVPTLTFNGTIAPSTIINSGLLATGIDGGTSAADIATIGTVQSSDYGTLTLDGDVTMTNATVRAGVGAGESDLLNITGNLDLNGGGNTLTIEVQSDQAIDAVVIKATTASGSFSTVSVDTPSFLTIGTVSADYSTPGEVKVTAAAPTLTWDATDGSSANGTFNLSPNQSFTVTNVLDENGVVKDLTKTGAGTLTLNAANTYSGTTAVQGGTLIVGDTAGGTASVAGSVDVQTGATVGGHGTLSGGLTLAAGSQIAPGTATSTGTLTVDGNVNLNNAAYVAKINPDGTSDSLHVTNGSVTLAGGDLHIQSGNGSGDWLPGSTTEYVNLLSADNGVNGTFTNVTNDLAFLTPTLDYQANAVNLTMVRGLGGAGTYLSRNQLNVANAIAFSLPATHPVFTSITAGMTAEQRRAAMDNFSGEIYGSTRSTLLSNHALRNAMQQRMQSGELLPMDERAWISTWGNTGQVDSSRNAAKTDNRSAGMALGTDISLGDSLSAGVVFGYEDGRVKNGDTRRSRSDIESYGLGGWLSADVFGLQLHGGMSASYLDMESKRNISTPGVQGSAKADYRGVKTQAFGEASKAIELDALSLSPYVGVTQTWLHTESVREKGSAAALDVKAQRDSVTQSNLGMRSAYKLPTAGVAITVDLGWQHAFGDTDGKTTNRFSGNGNSFSVQGAAVDKNTALIGAGVQAELLSSAALSFGYQGQFGSKAKDHAVGLQFKLSF